jgi:hypothetical protein
MDSDVTSTLSELERKLKELERELASVGRGGEIDAVPAQAGWTPAPVEPPAPDPGPPPAGATPFTAAWHGSGSGAAAPPPPVSPFDGAPPVPVTPPPTPWPAPDAGASSSPTPPPPAEPAAAPPPAPPSPPSPPSSGLHRQLDELLAFRDRLVRTTDDLVAELSRVLTELGADVAPDLADTVLSGAVIVDVAPFADLATLAAFEQALVRTPGVAEVDVRTLDAGRATIDVQLAGPVALAAVLRASAPVAFAVDDVREGRLTLTLAPPGT